MNIIGLDYKKANIDICRMLTEGKPICGGYIDDKKSMYFVAQRNGYYGYFFPKTLICFNTGIISPPKRPIHKVINFDIICKENHLTATKKLYSLGSNKIARIFTANGRDVLINNSFLKNLNVDICSFYQDKNDPRGIILATEGGKTPLMCICPITEINFMKRDCSTCLYGPLIKEKLCPHKGTTCGGPVFNYDDNVFDLFFIRPLDSPGVTAAYRDENISYKDLGYPKWVPSMDKLRNTIASVENRLNESRNKQGAPVTIAPSTLSDILVILKWVQGNGDE